SGGRLAVMFTRYHYTVFNSLADMVKTTLSPSASFDERRKAVGHLMVLGLLSYVGKPLLDSLAQKITANKDAEVRARGPLAPIEALKDYYKGKKDLGGLTTSMVTPTPLARLAIDTATNRDFAGRKIIEPRAAPQQQLAQALEHLASTIVAPYSTYQGAVLPHGKKASFGEELRNQFLDIKAPTAAQTKGQKQGQKRAKTEAQTRLRKPRGLIEYGASRYLPR